MMYSELAKSEDWDFRARWDTEVINSVIGVPWRMTDGKWTVDRPEVRVDPGSTNPEGKNHQARHRRIRTHFGMPRLQRNQGQQTGTSHSDRCRVRIEGCLGVTPQGAERLNRRREVINEALAEEFTERRPEE